MEKKYDVYQCVLHPKEEEETRLARCDTLRYAEVIRSLLERHKPSTNIKYEIEIVDA